MRRSLTLKSSDAPVDMTHSRLPHQSKVVVLLLYNAKTRGICEIADRHQAHKHECYDQITDRSH